MTLWVFGLAALAPVVSRTLAWGGAPASAWVEVCSAGGARWVQVADERVAPGQEHAPSEALQLDACPLCVLMGDRLAPTAHVTHLATPAALGHCPPIWSARAAPRPRILAAAPRGPPERPAPSRA
jgi:hypothetical protein